MYKKMITMVLVCMTAISIVACGRKTDEFHSTDISNAEVNSEKQNDELSSTDIGNTEVGSQKQNDELHSTDIGNTEVSSEKQEEPIIQFTSTYGYSINYYSNLFEVVTDEGNDCIQQKDQDLEKEAPVYIAITPIETGTSAAIAEGIALQSGKDDTQIKDVEFGSESYSAKEVVYEMEAEAGNVSNTSYVVEATDKVYLIELVFGKDTSAEIKKKLDETAASFLLTNNVVKTDNVSSEIIEGEFCGWADGHTVEVIVNGEPTAYMVENEKVKEVLENFDEGTVFTFETETDGEVKKISNIIGE